MTTKTEDLVLNGTTATESAEATPGARPATAPAVTRGPLPKEPRQASPVAPQMVEPAPADERRRGPSGRRRIVIAAAGLAVLALIGLGGRQWWLGLSRVTSDNAQVEGHIVPVLPRVSGYVAAVRVVENQTVRAGDPLVVLDDRDLAARLAQAEADLALATANAGSQGVSGQAPAELAAARAAVSQAEANAWRANRDLERYRTLAERDVIGRQQLDAAQAAAQAADAQLRAAREQVLAASAALRGADAKVAAAQAARDQAALQLSYARIAAPASGVVSRKSVEVGQLVEAGQPLMSVVPLDDVWVVANLRETEIKNVTPGDPVELEVDSYPGRRFHGQVESLSPATGAKFSLLPPDNATGNFTKVVQRVPVRIRLTGQEDPAHPLRPGMSVRVVITTR